MVSRITSDDGCKDSQLSAEIQNQQHWASILKPTWSQRSRAGTWDDTFHDWGLINVNDLMTKSSKCLDAIWSEQFRTMGYATFCTRICGLELPKVSKNMKIKKVPFSHWRFMSLWCWCHTMYTYLTFLSHPTSHPSPEQLKRPNQCIRMCFGWWLPSVRKLISQIQHTVPFWHEIFTTLWFYNRWCS